MIALFTGFQAPPARQATDRLAGKRGRFCGSAQPIQPRPNGDLPLTAAVRRSANPIEQATIVTALVALALMVVPLLVAH